MRSVNSLPQHDDVIEAEVIPMTATPAPLAPVTPETPHQPIDHYTWADIIYKILGWIESWGLLAWKLFKFSICIGLDIFDFFIGRLFGFGILFEAGCVMIAFALWGRWTFSGFWELIDITEQIDGFIPTCTIIALRRWND